jgi:fructose-1-phosphate kinase PfkB-like protein
LNVARAIHTLGSTPLCMGFAGGHSGRLLADLAQKDGLPSAWTWTDVETRTCTILVSQEGDATVINEPGPHLTAVDWERLQQDVRARGSQARFAMLASEGKQVWVDTSGAVLRSALEQSNLSIKVNAVELGEAVGFDATDEDLAQRALELLRTFQLRALVITLGSSGALLTTPEGSWHAEGPRVRVVSTVGSGDAFLGGLVTALDGGKSPPDALREAVAVGTANVLSPGGGVFLLEEFQEIRGQVRVYAIQRR